MLQTDLLKLGLNGSASYMYLDYNYYAWNVQGGRLQWLQAVQTAGYALRQKLEYAYDSAGNVDWVKDHLAGSPYQLQDYTYDLLNRLDAASASGGDGQGLYNKNYAYDAQGNLWKKGTVGLETVYTYLDSNHKHAVTHLGGVPMYGYDLNGNMTTRTVGSTTYTQGWDAENRLATVSGAGLSASFSYDGDGVRVKGTVNGAVTPYVGNWFEWTGSTSTMKKYYYAGSQRIAMRTGSGTGTSGLLWVIGDHLGSTTKIANYDGTLNSQRRYRPWGEWRFGGTLSTTFAFTGQRQEVQLGGADGLYDYGARWYDAALGRWLSPDSIIPEAAQGVQAWSRYTYVNNAPTRYQDQTGHWINFAAGIVVGAAIGMGSYLLGSALSGSFSCRNLALSTATGAAGGLLISTGVLAAAGSTMLATTLAGAGVGAITAEAAYNLTAGENYNSTDMLIAAGVGSAAGAANGALGMTSLAGTTAGWATELGINGVAGGVQHLATQLNHGATLNTSLLTESAVVGGLSASVTGLVNEVLSPQLPSLASNINKWAGAGSSPHLSRKTLNYLTRAYVTRDSINGLIRGGTAEIFSRYTTVSAE